MDSEDRSTQKDTSSSAVTSSLGDLIARLEKATGPDRELDKQIWIAVTPGATRKKTIIKAAHGQWPDYELDETRDATYKFIVVPEFTSSLDAAISLVPRPMCWNGGEVNEDDQPWACITDSEGADYAATAATPILALCIAALKARALNGQPLKGGQERTLTDAADASSVETASQKNSAADSSNAITDEGISRVDGEAQ